MNENMERIIIVSFNNKIMELSGFKSHTFLRMASKVTPFSEWH